MQVRATLGQLLGNFGTHLWANSWPCSMFLHSAFIDSYNLHKSKSKSITFLRPIILYCESVKYHFQLCYLDPLCWAGERKWPSKSFSVFLFRWASHLYKRVCPSVGPLVRWSMGPWVRRSVGPPCFRKKVENGYN